MQPITEERHAVKILLAHGSVKPKLVVAAVPATQALPKAPEAVPAGKSDAHHGVRRGLVVETHGKTVRVRGRIMTASCAVSIRGARPTEGAGPDAPRLLSGGAKELRHTPESIGNGYSNRRIETK